MPPYITRRGLTARRTRSASAPPTAEVTLNAMSTFVAIDFETATTRRDSACAVGLAAGCNGRVVLARTYLIRPPTAQFTFTDLHGLDWEDVHDAPTFAELWPTLRAWIDDAAFVAAHNAPFDRSVLHACCARYRLRLPRTPFTCTVQLARAQWGIRPTKLSDVCRRLRIPLRHHAAGSDALACARIVLAAQADGWLPGKRRTHRTATRTMVRVAPTVGGMASSQRGRAGTALLRYPSAGVAVGRRDGGHRLRHVSERSIVQEARPAGCGVSMA